jgi:aminoglycoside phosphotransferase (APT) family kinase protein
MPERPSSDRDLDASIALRAVREQFPALECQRATHLGSGWASDVYLLDDRFVARFPRNVELAGWVGSDQAILGLVTTHLASAFVVPNVVGRGRAGAHFPHDFLVCELVRGIGADRLATHSDEFISDLGHALTRIHAVPVDDARRVGLSQPEWDRYTGTLTFLHGDFSPDNIIIDPDNGRLVGVIDWGNAAIGDPALDFVPLVLSRGWTFVHAVLAAYQRPIDEGFVERVEFNAQIQALQWLTDSVKRRADLQFHLTWLRNAFSL